MSIPRSLIRSSRHSVILALMLAVGASVHHCFTAGKNLEVGLKKEGLLYFVRELDGNDEEEYDNYLKDASMYARVKRAVVKETKSTLLFVIKSNNNFSSELKMQDKEVNNLKRELVTAKDDLEQYQKRNSVRVIGISGSLAALCNWRCTADGLELLSTESWYKLVPLTRIGRCVTDKEEEIGEDFPRCHCGFSLVALRWEPRPTLHGHWFLRGERLLLQRRDVIEYQNHAQYSMATGSFVERSSFFNDVM
uniref:(California timema) hypothetical protein n=1 Tax=Timema californicum TaxID=61474 RepID=A0A7R9J7S9_TIMCA|nr:unnamed protein product [Timema californicum]